MKEYNESYVEDLKDNEEDETSKNDNEEKDYKSLYENQKIRAEKAEKKNKETKSETSTTDKKVNEKQSDDLNLSVKDSARLQQANIPVDDWDDVIDYANYKGITVAEAMKSSVVKSTLSQKEEERKTTQATNTGKGRKGSSKVSGSNALEKATKSGTIPDSDAELDAMLEERYKS